MKPKSAVFNVTQGEDKSYFANRFYMLSDESFTASAKKICSELRACAKDKDPYAERLIRQLESIGFNRDSIPEKYRNNPAAAADEIEKLGLNEFCKANNANYDTARAEIRRIEYAGLIAQGFENNPIQTILSHEKEYLVPKLGIPKEGFQQLYDIVPGLKELPKDEQKKYAEFQRQICEKLTHAAHVRNDIGIYCSSNPDGIPLRQVQSFVPYNDLSSETIKEFKKFWSAFVNGSGATADDKINAAIPMLNRVAKIDLLRLDPTDPQAILDNFDDALVIAETGSEFVTLRDRIREQTGVDVLTDPRFADFQSGYEAIRETSQLLKSTIEMMASDLFPYLGFETLKKVAADPLTQVEIEGDNGMITLNRCEAVNMLTNFDATETNDASAAVYLNRVYFNTSPIGEGHIIKDYNKSFRENFIDNIITKKDVKGAKRYFSGMENLHRQMPGEAEYTSYARHDALTLDLRGDIHKTVDKYLYSSGSTYNIPDFHPYCPGDAERLYVKGKNGKFVKAFPDFGKYGHAGLNDEQLTDIFTSTDKYIYFPAGKTVPKVFRGGRLEDTKKSSSELKFGPEATRRFNGEFTESEKKLFDSELRRHQLDTFFFDMCRVDEMHRSIYGYNLNNTGDENYISFTQKVVKRLADDPNAESAKYPEPCGVLTDSEIVTLSMLSMARTDVNGKNYEKASAEACTITDFNMAVNDMYVSRSGLSDTTYVRGTMQARVTLAPALKKYNETNGDPAALAETIAKGLHVLSIACSNLTALNFTTMCELVPAKNVAEMLSAHPDLLESARNYAKEHNIDTFESDLERCRISAKLHTTAVKCLEDERRLLAYEAGELTDVNGKAMTISNDERRRLETSRRKLRFLDECIDLHNLVTDRQVPEAIIKKQASDLIELATANIDLSGVQAESLAYQRSMPISNVLNLIYATENGEKAFDAFMSNVSDADNYHDISCMLKQQGFLPGLDKLPKIDSSNKDYTQKFAESDMPVPGFDYEKAAENCLECFSEKKISEVREKYGSVLDELKLDYSDVLSLAADKGISAEDYLDAVVAENAAAERTAAGPKKGDTLGDFEEKLADENIDSLSPDELCDTLKKLNSYAHKHLGDIYATSQAGSLISKTCTKIFTYQKEHPEFDLVRDGRLGKQNLLDAHEHILRGTEAAKKMKAEELFTVTDKESVRNISSFFNPLRQNMLDRLNGFEQQVAQYDAIIEGALGAKPGLSDDLRQKAVTDVIEVINASSDSSIDIPEGFTNKMVTNLVRFNLATSENIMKATHEDPVFNSNIDQRRTLCVTSPLEDLGTGRANAAYNLIKGYLKDARLGVKQALDEYASKKNPAPLGKLIAETLPMFVNESINSYGNIQSSKCFYSMKNCLSVFDILEKNPDIMRSAKENGLSENVIKTARCGKRLIDIRKNGCIAERKLLSENPPTGAKLRESIADVLIESMTNAALSEIEEKITEIAATNAANAQNAKNSIELITVARNIAVLNTDSSSSLKLFDKYSDALRENLMRSPEFKNICAAAEKSAVPGMMLANDRELDKLGKKLHNTLLDEKSLSKTQEELQKMKSAQSDVL